MMESTNKNILSRLWEFVNKSPIISAILISVITVIGLLLFKFYLFIYWLPYFESYNIPLNYFQEAEFDKLSLTYRWSIDIFFTYLFFYLFLKIWSKVDFKDNRKNFGILILMILIAGISIILQSFLVRKHCTISFLSVDIWSYITLAAIIYLIYRIIRFCSFRIRNIKLKISTTILCLFLVLMGIGIAIKINGYNEQVVPALVGEFKVIDENKAILFETADKYYIVPCTIENNSIKLYTGSYSFVEKNKTLVNKRYFHHVYKL